jgi:hypothetical protein
MDTMTTTPVPDSSVSFPAHPDRRSQAQAIRATLDQAAEAINAQHAQVLSAVIAMKEQNLHRSAFGFSALFDLLKSQFDFHNSTAADIAIIAKLSRKFGVLTQAATTGLARIDQVAYAVRQLEKTPAMRLFARTPFREPVTSPFDPKTSCATPEALIAQYCAHAPFKDLQRHLHELAAQLADESELLDSLGEQSLQWIEIAKQGNGMWSLSGELSDETGRLLDKYLKTACPPPRQEDQDEDGILPAAPNRHAEALHQLLAGYGSSSEASTRHGHTATLDLVVDVETLQGKDTGRTPLLEGQPASVARARLLACEAVVIPSVFNYKSGEAIELGRAARLPNAALRRKLELEQPEGCAWTGCSLPVAWTEAHHIVHWADGGVTAAENLILLCRFHHGRIHTTGWTVEKTAPGQAIITHHDSHEGHEDQGSKDTAGCGCSDWRSDADMDAEHRADDFDYFPTGLYRSEWSENMKFDLDTRAEAAEQAKCLAAMRAAKAKCRERFATPAKIEANPGELNEKAPEPEQVGASDLGDPPFLRCPLRGSDRGGEGKAHHQPSYGLRLPSSNPQRVRAHPHARQQQSTRTRQPPNPFQDQCDLFVAARLNSNHLRTGQPENPAPPCVHLVVAAA